MSFEICSAFSIPMPRVIISHGSDSLEYAFWAEAEVWTKHGAARVFFEFSRYGAKYVVRFDDDRAIRPDWKYYAPDTPCTAIEAANLADGYLVKYAEPDVEKHWRAA